MNFEECFCMEEFRTRKCRIVGVIILTNSSEYLLPSDPPEYRFSTIHTSPLLPKSPRDDALIVPNDG